MDECKAPAFSSARRRRTSRRASLHRHAHWYDSAADFCARNTLRSRHMRTCAWILAAAVCQGAYRGV